MTALFIKNIRIFSIQHDVVRVSPVIKYFKTKALNRISKVIAISESVKCFLMDYFLVPENKIETIYHGVDFDKFSVGQKENSSGSLVFGTIARLDKIKGHIYILEALKILKQKNITPKYIIVGSGSEENTLRNFVRDNSLDNVCFFKEAIDVVPLLKEIDVFVMPSLSEGLGIAVIEAMVARKLLIVSDIQALRELVKNDLTGILVEVGNIHK
ncbi:MAG: glycosyltransferase family 4 protein [Candidatus Paceibacterota bacterium]